MKNYTINDGLKVQSENIVSWANVLNEKALRLLREKVDEENKKLTANSSGYDVFRGSDITNFIENLKYLI